MSRDGCVALPRDAKDFFLRLMIVAFTDHTHYYFSHDLLSRKPYWRSKSILFVLKCLLKLDAIMCSIVLHKNKSGYKAKSAGSFLSPFLK